MSLSKKKKRSLCFCAYFSECWLDVPIFSEKGFSADFNIFHKKKISPWQFGEKTGWLGQLHSLSSLTTLAGLGQAGYRDHLDVSASLRCSPMLPDANLRHQTKKFSTAQSTKGGSLATSDSNPAASPAGTPQAIVTISESGMLTRPHYAPASCPLRNFGGFLRKFFHYAVAIV